VEEEAHIGQQAQPRKDGLCPISGNLLRQFLFVTILGPYGAPNLKALDQLC
jgi:hypothetical protein